MVENRGNELRFLQSAPKTAHLVSENASGSYLANTGYTVSHMKSRQSFIAANHRIFKTNDLYARVLCACKLPIRYLK